MKQSSGEHTRCFLLDFDLDRSRDESDELDDELLLLLLRERRLCRLALLRERVLERFRRTGERECDDRRLSAATDGAFAVSPASEATIDIGRGRSMPVAEARDGSTNEKTRPSFVL